MLDHVREPAPATLPLLSVLDLAHVGPGELAGDSLRASVVLAQRAEALGYRRVWYAEHHNMARIASSATSVLVGHVADRTRTIRVGAGGVMLPNHAPLTIAEQFGTLASLHPGRIDLGLGRAPGSDQVTLAALRRGPSSADRFPEDVLELQGYLSDESRVPGVHATPGRGTYVPLYILGSSLFGAQLAALLGLPYAFASHFAPAALEQAVSLYRRSFRPSAQQEVPYVIAGLNVVVADDPEVAAAELRTTLRRRAAWLVGRGRELTDDEADALLASPAGAHVREMLTCTAVGTPAEAVDALAAFTARAGADEVIVALQSPSAEGRVRSLELLAAAVADAGGPGGCVGGGVGDVGVGGVGDVGVGGGGVGGGVGVAGGVGVPGGVAGGVADSVTGGGPERISAVTLAVADMARATGFYEALGFVRRYGGPGADFTSYVVGDGHLNLQADPGRSRTPGWGRVIVWVDDVDALHRRAVAAGMAPSSAPADAPWGERYFHLCDPDGHELSFAVPLPDGHGTGLGTAEPLAVPRRV